jgi:hypothetical protein
MVGTLVESTPPLIYNGGATVLAQVEIWSQTILEIKIVYNQ